EALEAEREAKAGRKLTREHEEAKKEWEDVLKDIQPPPDEVKKEIADYRGGYPSALKRRGQMTMRWHSKPFYFPGMADMYALMLIGIAFMKKDVLTAERSWRFYFAMALLGYLLGLPVNALAAWQSIQVNFEPVRLPFIFATYHSVLVPVALWPRAVCAFRAISAVLRSGTDLVVQPGLESHLAKAFPLRAARVVLAFADLLEEAADADQKRACDDAHHRRDIPVGECVADRRPELPATPSALKSGTWGGAGRQTCRLERDRGDLALKSSFVPLGGRTGLIAHPRMYRVVLRQPHLMTRATDSQRLKPKVRHVSCRSFVTSNSADGEFHDRGYCDSLTVSTWSASTFS